MAKSPKSLKIYQKEDKELIELREVVSHPTVLGFLEFATGTAGTSKSELLMAGGRIAQAAFRGKTLRQLGLEIKSLRARGKLDDKDLESPYGIKCFEDILKALEEENIDPKKWTAIKNIFLNSISKSRSEIEKRKAYYLMSVALQLKTFDIEVLSFCYKKIPDHGSRAINASGQWVEMVSSGLGYGLPEFVSQSDERLVNLGLLTPRTFDDKSGVVVGDTYRLTSLGIALCELIEDPFVEI